MTRLDRLIAAVAPAYALKRYESRVRLDAAVRSSGPAATTARVQIARHDQELESAAGRSEQRDGPRHSSAARPRRGSRAERSGRFAAADRRRRRRPSAWASGARAREPDYLGLDDPPAMRSTRRSTSSSRRTPSPRRGISKAGTTSTANRISRCARFSAAATPSLCAASSSAQAISSPRAFSSSRAIACRRLRSHRQ
jgi:hypothetical protein